MHVQGATCNCGCCTVGRARCSLAKSTEPLHMMLCVEVLPKERKGLRTCGLTGGPAYPPGIRLQVFRSCKQGTVLLPVCPLHLTRTWLY